ncbi:Uncharacterised protein [Salmonella enterica subsp. enterica serovar Bovismorbificans]|uniref:Uncharacterized protein n=1 Tax=Salmonella enterica subsp. enterica serovar Bovismorbificans TaxID=58097 RepID=A0A655BSH9_SALET|nr:Uncharacterised protein [Salmonella enterica subsp. enterica serovar Bovismorbificans]CNU48715.1 Uncharacterised protein [Salmonella enterica subsp. enterica serovar Bovismorbificans]CNU94896.1 Uncharacterised protein [Salmonella enterica subsp. enterica serovar Bovismorbificans]CPR41007.1 Uncharacterised protein [Salmonella enterica subsp. enterica serovar Bovismorbificans]
MTTFQRCSHHVNVADTFKTEIYAAISKLNNNVLDRFVVIIRINKVRGPHFARQRKFFRIRVDS